MAGEAARSGPRWLPTDFGLQVIYQFQLGASLPTTSISRGCRMFAKEFRALRQSRRVLRLIDKVIPPI